ncbi:competence/damage-inducible protein A [Leptolyngbya sp. PCC 6406]|uniref:competence/damage-inducible protein A n=1 Tax=Leptolyngbya sp. PCC 6406 TaxID=1173264 RepID=UPI0002AD0A8A|nr:competence/damage-inducible protein A [Leptolyngbya sp. PCC 6406]
MTGSAEIICIGTELLLGDILNSNAQFLAQELAQLGIPHYYQTVVGDNPARIQQAVAIAAERSTLLVFTGGLGPTPDDLTHETLATCFQVPLTERPEVLADIRHKFASRGRTLVDSNHKQALLPTGAAVLPNPIGTAPGILWQPCPGLTLLTFPGVPSEMKAMWRQTAVPYLQSQGWGQSVIYSRTLKFWGIGESNLAEQVAPLLALANPTVAPYAGGGAVKLRVSTQAASEAEAKAAIAPVAAEIQRIAGDHYYGDDDATLASVVGDVLTQRRETVAVAESCTGGGLGHALTTVAGSSSYFLGGVITYDNRIKTELLAVDTVVLAQRGAVSPEVACQMAKGVRSCLSSDWGVSITGVAGPGGGSETKPVGLVYISVASPDGSVESQEYHFGATGGRDWVRHLSIQSALNQLRLACSR